MRDLAGRTWPRVRERVSEVKQSKKERDGWIHRCCVCVYVREKERERERERESGNEALRTSVDLDFKFRRRRRIFHRANVPPDKLQY